MNGKIALIVSIGIVVCSLGFLVYTGLNANMVYYFHVDEFLTKAPALQGETVKVNGKVVKGTIAKVPNGLPFYDLRLSTRESAECGVSRRCARHIQRRIGRRRRRKTGSANPGFPRLNSAGQMSNQVRTPAAKIRNKEELDLLLSLRNGCRRCYPNSVRILSLVLLS